MSTFITILLVLMFIAGLFLVIRFKEAQIRSVGAMIVLFTAFILVLQLIPFGR